MEIRTTLVLQYEGITVRGTTVRGLLKCLNSACLLFRVADTNVKFHFVLNVNFNAENVQSVRIWCIA